MQNACGKVAVSNAVCARVYKQILYTNTYLRRGDRDDKYNTDVYKHS